MKRYVVTKKSSRVSGNFPPFRARPKLWNLPHANMCAARLKACFATAYTCPLAYLTSFPLNCSIRNVTTRYPLRRSFNLMIKVWKFTIRCFRVIFCFLDISNVTESFRLKSKGRKQKFSASKHLTINTQRNTNENPITKKAWKPRDSLERAWIFPCEIETDTVFSDKGNGLHDQKWRGWS